MPGTSALFPDNDTEAWRGKVTCPESHSEWEAGLGCEAMNASSASVLSRHVAAPGQPLVTSRSYAFPFLLLFKLHLSPSAFHFPLHPLLGGQGGTSFSTLLTLPTLRWGASASPLPSPQHRCSLPGTEGNPWPCTELTWAARSLVHSTTWDGCLAVSRARYALAGPLSPAQGSP